ncbi:hypothetical protein Ais01nite_52080 [Asanoa ishikariensis]|uniref:CU044_5270 family protein n=1 Tax=Asanoa ishikariensis TaxID=137265 RepID=A0A1H3RIK4_9ACTN|nr:hypothetical protein [Asanoa ishikariensis]GIF67173.1 hypothetical protein Ais01nite_52080 [Asanoa ishikariensis]SDZ25574.1 hypothetical protein SAMN05421684_3870 [Asanoa ishikariensis]
MNRADPDIIAIRDLPPGSVEPTDESVSRTWHAMTRRQVPPARSRFRRWVPAAAALVVAGLATTGVVALQGGGADPGIGVGSAPSSPKVADPSAAGPKGGGAPTGGADKAAPPLPLGSSKSINARQSLDRLAAKVAGSPTRTVQPGQLIYTRMYGVTSSVNIGEDSAPVLAADEAEFWFTPQGMTAVKVIQNGAENPTSADTGATVDKPYIWQPTPEWLAALPTQPAALRNELLEGIRNDKWSDDHLLAKEIGELLVSSELLLPADVRVAMLKSIKSWKGLSARETVFDGKRVWAIRQTEQGRFDELLFDPTTGRAVGRASGIGGTVSYQVLWTHKIVAKAGDRSE